MAEDPINQQQFEEDVIAAAAANDGQSFVNPDGMGADGSDFKMPSADEVWKLIEQMEGLSDEERENLRESIYFPKGNDDLMQRLTGQGGAVAHTNYEYMVFMAMIGIILLVFALFGYKLYKSLMEKELKKKEKLKNKQTKKSKKSN